MTVPGSSLVRRGQLVGVFVADSERKARFRLVKTGQEDGSRVEVLSGLGEGDKVVVEPGLEVREGIPLSVGQAFSRVPGLPMIFPDSIETHLNS